MTDTATTEATPVVLTARLALDRGLARHESRVPCRTDPDAWHAEAAQRQEAATACQPCPLLDACRTYAVTAGEVLGVWGGLDMQDPAVRRRAQRQRRAARQDAETTTTTERAA